MRTENIREVFNKENIDGKCRMFYEREGIMEDIVSKCPKATQTEYKK